MKSDLARAWRNIFVLNKDIFLTNTMQRFLLLYCLPLAAHIVYSRTDPGGMSSGPRDSPCCLSATKTVIENDDGTESHSRNRELLHRTDGSPEMIGKYYQKYR